MEEIINQQQWLGMEELSWHRHRVSGEHNIGWGLQGIKVGAGNGWGKTSKEAFLFHNCLRSMCPPWPTENKVPWSQLGYSPTLFLYSEKEVSSETCLSLCDYHKGERFKTSISKYFSQWKNFSPYNMWKMSVLLTFSQVMSSVFYGEWTTVTKRF